MKFYLFPLWCRNHTSRGGIFTIFTLSTVKNSNMNDELEFRSDLEYQIQTNCSDDTEGFSTLKPIIQSASTFVKLLGGSIVPKEFWSYGEGAKFASTIVGYNISIVFNRQAGSVYKFPLAISLFFEGYNAVKLKEQLYFVPKDDHN